MKFVRTSLLSFFFFYTSIASLAQTGSDLLITNAGDTLKGTLKAIENYSTSLSFRSLDENAYKAYSASDISFALSKTRMFKSVTIESISRERIVLQVLAVGDITLYKGRNRYYLQKDTVFQMLTRKDTVINNVQKKDRSYIGHLTIMMLDRAVPIEKINATGFNDDDLTRLVMHYNGDNDGQVTSGIYGKKAEPIFTVGIKGGPYLSTFEYVKGTYSGYTFETHSGTLLGTYVLIRLANKLYIQPELFFVSKGGKYSIGPLNYGVQKMDFDYLIKSGQISLNLRYNILNRRLSPYVLAGFCYAASKSSRTHRRVYYGDYAANLLEIAVVSEIGYRGAAGVNYKINETWQVSVEGLWEKTRIHTKDDDFYSNGLGALINIGYVLGNSK